MTRCAGRTTCTARCAGSNRTKRSSRKTIDRHQLIYLMEGKGRVRLDGKDYDVEKGAGIYLGPTETAAISAANGASLKLFHLVVPHIPK